MSDDITGLCRDHSFETATAMCRRCSLEFCDICVVYPFGPKKPYCKECAMAAGGVRTHVSRAAQPPRLVRRRVKAFEAYTAGKDAGGASPSPVLVDPISQDSIPSEMDPIAAPVPALSGSGATDLLDEIPDAPLPPPPPPGAGESTDGLAPPIDWNQPFG